jgi:UDP-N-acetylglucosamine acyltransferase
MTTIDPTARVEPGAQIGQDVSIGPYCVIGPNVAIGDGCRLVAQIHITGHTTIGPRCVVYPFASLGTPPQSVKYRGGPTRLVIGAGCEIRESVTMNIGTEADRGVTEVGERCFIMVGVHIAHDCHVGNDVTMANNVVLGGHVTVGDSAVFGGSTAVHQFVRIGRGAMVAGFSGIPGDIIPFGLAMGERAKLIGLNVIGMRRRGFSRDDIHRARRFYRDLFLGEGTFAARLAVIEPAAAGDPILGEIISFIRGRKRRALLMARAGTGDEPADAP